MILAKLHLLPGETIPQVWAKASEFFGYPFYDTRTPCGMIFDDDGRLVMVLRFESREDAEAFRNFRMLEVSCRVGQPL
jgi:hypothetical protein